MPLGLPCLTRLNVVWKITGWKWLPQFEPPGYSLCSGPIRRGVETVVAAESGEPWRTLRQDHSKILTRVTYSIWGNMWEHVEGISCHWYYYICMSRNWKMCNNLHVWSTRTCLCMYAHLESLSRYAHLLKVNDVGVVRGVTWPWISRFVHMYIQRP